MNKKGMEIGLLWHSLTSDNLGVGALSISNILILDQAAAKLALPLTYRVAGTNGQKDYSQGISKNPISFNKMPSMNSILKEPKLWVDLFKGCDVVFDIGEGDSFSDIYGWRRYITQMLSKYFVMRSGMPVILAPQTIGPFNKAPFRCFANMVMKKATKVFVRDSLSSGYMESNKLSHIAQESTDVAFGLPFVRSKKNYTNQSKKKFQVGLNVSALLFHGGYTQKNQFKLRCNYKKLIIDLLNALTQTKEYGIHLIPHVLADHYLVEDDYRVSQQLCKQYPSLIIPPKFASPIEAKSYISKMDFFIGSRMHSTIAALSSGVPVIPIAYSRKFIGLFQSLGYDYVIDATKSNEEEIISFILNSLQNRSELAEIGNKGVLIAKDKLKTYSDFVVDFLGKVRAEKK